MVEKALQIKSRHHYVWANYLKRWTTDGTNIHHTTSKKNIAHSSIRGVAVEKYLYKITPLNTEDIKLIYAFSKQSDEDLQKLHHDYLMDFLKISKAELFYKEHCPRDEEAEIRIEALYCNLLENLHSSHEESALPVLEGLSKGNIEILQEGHNMLEFMCFLGHQLTRTKSFRDIFLRGLSHATDQEQKFSASITKAWWFYNYMIGMNIGRSLFLSRKDNNHSLLINNTDTPFITSDQPVINIHPSLTEKPKDTPPKNSDIYYPISPTIAYVTSESTQFSPGTTLIDEATAAQLNLKLAKRADIYLFANKAESLSKLIKHIGQSTP